ncbi:Flippase [Bifidobacterium pseudolongum subsp. globosum]|uniref:Flippase n=1 Tax=Bifidobacterium pseudolongum subsp. globosum TaxID=1690 RepID=A0A2N3QE45_9BIFI|nr:flippase [Bifidobacterium pseudolongum]PKU88395.1 Flippase [Bifidobacterium pseudolongum subsp. globosum]
MAKFMQQKKPVIRSVKYNVVMNVILTTSSFLFPLVTVPYVSRVLGPDGMGLVAWAQTFISYFALVALLGINNYGIRECAKVRDDLRALSQTTKELMTFLLISTTIVYVIYCILVFLIPRTRDHLVLMAIFSVGIWFTSCGVEWFYQAIEQYGYITIRNIILKVVGLVLMFLLIHNTNDYLGYGIVVVVGSYTSNIFNIIRLRKYVDFKQCGKLDLRRHIKPMISFAVSNISSGMYGQIDMLLIGFWGSGLIVGLYQFVVKIKMICITAITSVGSVMLPRISYFEANGGHDSTTKLVGKNINFLFISSLAIIAALAICGEPIILLLGGPQYLDSRLALILIAPVLLFASANTVLSQYMVATGREKAYAAVNFTGLLLGIMYGVVLIPSMGLNGAALGASLCEFTILIIRVIVLRKSIREILRDTDVFKILAGFMMAFGITTWVKHCVESLLPVLQLGICALVFLVVYFGILLILKEEFIQSLYVNRKIKI